MPAAKAFYCDVADGLYCNAEGTSGSRCSKIAAVGGACTGFESLGCTKDAYCDASSSKCAPRVANGADCKSISGICVAGSYCTKDTMKCAPQLTSGATCTASEQCVSKSCVNTKCVSNSSSSLALVCGG